MSSPLSDDAINARATYLRQLDLVDDGVDAVEMSRTLAARKETIAALRVQLNLLRESYKLVDAISYLSTHEKGRKALAKNGVKARAVSARAVIEALEREWDGLENKPRRDTFVKENYDRICTDSYGENKEKWITERYFKRLLNPNERRKV